MTPHLRHAAVCLALLGGTACAHEPSRPEVTALLQRADAALAEGRSLDAQAAYEQAAALEHAARIEVGWVRARMQAGGYRQAVAFAAHAAGAHPDEAHGALLYAHLLNAGGQARAAQGVLSRARVRLPDEPLLRASLTSCPADGDPGVPDDLQLPSVGERVPAGLVVAGSALLLDDARDALVPLALVDDETPLWVRNGLGRTQAARVLSRDASTGTAVLALAAPLDAPARLTRAPRDAFPGSPAFVTGYRADPQAQPAWPQLCTGFLGTPPRDGGPRPLGIAIEGGSVGAPVFDSAARLVGLVGPAGPSGAPTLLSLRHLASVQTSNDTAAKPLDEVYERSMRSSLQLIRRPLGAAATDNQTPDR